MSVVPRLPVYRCRSRAISAPSPQEMICSFAILDANRVGSSNIHDEKYSKSRCVYPLQLNLHIEAALCTIPQLEIAAMHPGETACDGEPQADTSGGRTAGGFQTLEKLQHARSEERRVGKESRSRWAPY